MLSDAGHFRLIRSMGKEVGQEDARRTAFCRLLPSKMGRFGSRLCENALNTSKTESREGCLWNQRAEARISLVSDIDFVMPFGPRQRPKRLLTDGPNGWVHALIASSSPAMSKMLIIRLRL